jgi:hypothetical protein
VVAGRRAVAHQRLFQQGELCVAHLVGEETPREREIGVEIRKGRD